LTLRLFDFGIGL